MATVNLKDARPSDRVHLLLWETPNPFDLDEICWYSNAQLIHYRDHLLQRLEPGSRKLALHHRWEEELALLPTLCQQSAKPAVLITELDALIIYLQLHDLDTLFWSHLMNMRKLSHPLWLLLPPMLLPKSWPSDRCYTMT